MRKNLKMAVGRLICTTPVYVFALEFARLFAGRMTGGMSRKFAFFRRHFLPLPPLQAGPRLATGNGKRKNNKMAYGGVGGGEGCLKDGRVD